VSRSVELTHTVPAPVKKLCARARASVSIAVTCPRLVPATPVAGDAEVSSVILFPPARDFYMLNFNSDRRGALHWIVGAGRPASVARWVLGDSENEVKGRPRLVSTASVDGTRIDLYRFPPFPAGGPNGSHVAALVRSGRLVKFVSIHGYRHGDAALAMLYDLVRGKR
jgi:hypothetical protein